MAVFDPDNLHLTDFMDLATLQEIQDSFAAVAEVKATITAAACRVVTQPTPTRDFLRRQRVLADAALNAAPTSDDGSSSGGAGQPQREGAEYVAPIVVNDQRLGTIRMAASGSALWTLDESKVAGLAQKFKLEP